MSLIASMLRSSALRPFGVHVNPKGYLVFFKQELIWVERCCSVLRQAHSLFAYQALLRSCGIIRSTTQAIEVSKHLVHFLLEHVSTTGKCEGLSFTPVPEFIINNESVFHLGSVLGRPPRGLSLYSIWHGTLLVNGVALIGPRNMWSPASGTDWLAPLLVASIVHISIILL